MISSLPVPPGQAKSTSVIGVGAALMQWWYLSCYYFSFLLTILYLIVSFTQGGFKKFMGKTALFSLPFSTYFMKFFPISEKCSEPPYIVGNAHENDVWFCIFTQSSFCASKINQQGQHHRWWWLSYTLVFLHTHACRHFDALDLQMLVLSMNSQLKK